MCIDSVTKVLVSLLKCYFAAKGTAFFVMTVLLPLLLDLNVIQKCWKLIVARRSFRRVLEEGKTSISSSVRATAENLYDYHFACTGPKIRVPPLKVPIEKFAQRLHRKLEQFRGDLEHFERRMEMGHLADMTMPILEMLQLCATGAPLKLLHEQLDEITTHLSGLPEPLRSRDSHFATALQKKSPPLFDFLMVSRDLTAGRIKTLRKFLDGVHSKSKEVND